MKKLVTRRWGYYKVLHEGVNYVVKELVIYPNCGISYQRHLERQEFWWVQQGKAQIKYSRDLEYNHWSKEETREEGGTFCVEENMWHMVWNDSEQDLHILEMQVGECSEEDIERLYYFEDWQRRSHGASTGSLKAGSGLVS